MESLSTGRGHNDILDSAQVLSLIARFANGQMQGEKQIAVHKCFSNSLNVVLERDVI